MADMKAVLENRKLRMKGPLPENMMLVKAARVIEGLSQVTEMSVDFMSIDKSIDLAKVVGKPITVRMMTGENDKWREFVGTCIEGQYLGLHSGYGFYTLQVRPWIWFLTRATNNRIFQNMTAVDIVRKVFQGHGFADFTMQVSRTPAQRIYTVQYNETDYAFICRLMEEEGIYFFSIVKGGKDHLMVVDDIGAHAPVVDEPEIEFALREGEYRRANDHIFEWRGSERVTSGKVTLNDWNFEKPKADLKSAKAIPKGSHSHKNYELYQYPGHYRETDLGEIHARIKIEAEAVKNQTRDAVGNVRTLAAAATFKLKAHQRAVENQDYLITSAVHMMQIESDQQDETTEMARDMSKGVKSEAETPGSIEFDERNKDAYRCTFTAIPKTVPFRAPLTTDWPSIPGILIARVTGPSGEEIHTDKYGRIKVQFPWDREGKNDENTTCWVRVVTPWSGKGWGMIAVPRIGQEVIIQFEDGDPDRPICTGMLYNADTMPPYALPGNMTQSGVKTRSTKGGGETNFNELMMEDKKDAELVRLQSEKDYVEIIKNNATITIGMEKKDPGNLHQTIYANKTEIIKTGDMTFTVEKGNEHRDIKTDKNEKIGANSDLKVDGNVTAAVKGNEDRAVTGNYATKVDGNSKEDVKGTFTSKTIGAVTIESTQKIVLKVGGNSITIDNSGITIKGIMVKSEASTVNEVKGSAMVKIQGGITMIN